MQFSRRCASGLFLLAVACGSSMPGGTGQAGMAGAGPIPAGAAGAAAGATSAGAGASGGMSGGREGNAGGEVNSASGGAATGGLGGVGAASGAAGNGGWQVPPIEALSVYGFSQVALNERDPQLFVLKPDIVIRAWGWWDVYGHRANDYDFSLVNDAHAAGIVFTGGGTASVVFHDEFPDEAAFDALVSRDGSGQIPPRSTPPILFRASLANADYRRYLIDAAKLQIDGGVDALFFDELNGSYAGVAYDGNEGFDRPQLADFNAFLLAKYAGTTDFATLFGLTPDNTLHPELAPDDPRNFDYLAYLGAHGWAQNPLTPANPLASEWGGTIANYPDPDTASFVDTTLPQRYWKEIADAVRAYAHDQYGRKVLLTSNGIWPYVDFQSVGLYDNNQHGPNRTSYDYVPVQNQHLAGTQSLAAAFRVLKARSERLAPGAPVVLFIDWPGSTMDRYIALPTSEQKDYWRLYAAEAYANGVFFAFHLKTTTGEPSATDAQLLDFLTSLAGYYRAHGDLFHGTASVAATVTGAPASAMISVMDQSVPSRRLVHLVNHEYEQAFVPQANLGLGIASTRSPVRVSVASPDLPADVELPFTYADGRVNVTLPSLVASDTLILAY